MTFYEPGWRSQRADGETPWRDAWTTGSYAQQLRGAGNADPEYGKRYESLTKNDTTDVDDDGSWRHVSSLDNRNAGTKEEMQRLADEWKSKGYDVRVQDLDGSQGANWADLAVRKGKGQPEETESAPREPSKDLLDARETWDRYEERRGEGSIHYDPTSGERGEGVVDGVGAAADYGNRATDDYNTRFIQHLNAQANLEALEMGDAGGRHLDEFEGEVPELASSDIKDLYEYYSKKITA
jgi:hypothetical protein